VLYTKHKSTNLESKVSPKWTTSEKEKMDSIKQTEKPDFMRYEQLPFPYTHSLPSILNTSSNRNHEVLHRTHVSHLPGSVRHG
jgi:hypothetical protein